MSDDLASQKPQIFFIIMLVCVPVCALLIYITVGFYQAFLAGFFGLRLIIFAYVAQRDEKVRDEKELENEHFALVMVMPICMIVFGLWQGGVFGREDFVLNKSELSQVSGIIPEKYTYVGGYKAPDRYYLTISDVRLNCAENDKDYCKDVYKYARKTATIYYQPKARNGNLVYEIIVNDIKPFALYGFDGQLYDFKRVRQQENLRLVAYFVILFIMCFIFWFGSRDFADYLEVMNDEEKAEYDEKHNKPQISSPSIRDFRFLGSMMYVVGLFVIVISFLIGVYALFVQKFILLFVCIIALTLSILVVQKSERDAEKRHNERLGINDN
ncbi:DUF3784 domain-containing protein [Moraxella oblonga]|uniref:DUF3784 domain-containing protein n=1 Tax=Moraxella oblonga TaxID=200413 RepID=UPI000830966A|nr:DUF3784 domain-containing protein [Moraxella oblonga]